MYSKRSRISVRYPWFERWHEMVLNCNGQPSEVAVLAFDDDAALGTTTNCLANDSNQKDNNDVYVNIGSQGNDPEEDPCGQEDDDGERGSVGTFEHGRGLPSLGTILSDSVSDPFALRLYSGNRRSSSTSIPVLLPSPSSVIGEDEGEGNEEDENDDARGTSSTPTPLRSQGPAAKKCRTGTHDRDELVRRVATKKSETYNTRLRFEEQRFLAEEQKTKREEMRLAFETARWNQEIELRREERQDQKQKADKDRDLIVNMLSQFARAQEAAEASKQAAEEAAKAAKETARDVVKDADDR
jgi:hypothetical protein